MKVVAVVQARMGSTRLPGKVILPLARKSVVEHIFERLAASRTLDAAVLATTGVDRDRPLRALAGLRGWPIVMGGELNVLGRYTRAAERFAADHIVRVTSDCPLIDVPGLDLCVEHHLKSGADYTHNCGDTGYETLSRGAALGLGGEVIRREALLAQEKFDLQPQHREHVTSLILENPETFSVTNLPARTPELARGDVRLTLDRGQDYEVLRGVFDALYEPGRPVDAVEAIRWLDAHPEVRDLNRDVRHTRLKMVYKVTPAGRTVGSPFEEARA
ncbi:MAG: glycosyltransferase family protein [Nitrospirae bacterium]|nr:glycosyltransferase family protein [Nitrospirota bacterium]